MKNKLWKAAFAALSVSIGVSVGIALIKLLQGEGFSLFNTCLYGVVAFVVNLVFSLVYDKNDKKINSRRHIK